MNVALFGSTGFVGNYITSELIDSGYSPRLLVRPGSLSKLHADTSQCHIIEGDIDNDLAVDTVLEGSQVAIYNIGIIREFLRRGITYEKLHYESVKKIE